MSAAAAAAAALLAAHGTGWLVRRRWADRALDRPGPRRSHDVPTTRLGGLAVAAGLAAGLAAAGVSGGLGGRALAAVAAGAAIAGAAGLAEDLRGVGIAARFGAQVAAAAVAGALAVEGSWTGALVAALWVVAFTNVFNFMDGVNGLAAAQLAVAGGAWLAVGALDDLAAVRLLGAVSLATAAGFLPHNFPRASVFMGDLGAYTTGAWLATGSVVGIRAGAPVAAMLAPLAVFVADAAWTLAGRVRRGKNVLEAHRGHLYQRLAAAGWSHARTTGLVAGLAAVTAAAGLLALAGPAGTVVSVVVGTVAFAGYVAVAATAGRRVAGPGR